MTKEELIKFETEIADLYKEGKIRTPVHLGGDNEDELIEIFKDIKKEDWILSTWRNHYHWLLSGRSASYLRERILSGNSMHIYDDTFFTSAIVGGIAPIAVGIGWALKQQDSEAIVHCFLGDMGASTGIAMESIRYVCGHKLPVQFYIEDNGLSVRTDTQEVWGCKDCGAMFDVCYPDGRCRKIYKYNRKYPHAGIGKKVLF